jgi:hypothetical protein
VSLVNAMLLLIHCCPVVFQILWQGKNILDINECSGKLHLQCLSSGEIPIEGIINAGGWGGG